MLRLLGKHPYLSLAALLAVHPGIVFLLYVAESRAYLGSWVEDACSLAWWIGAVAIPAIACFPVALRRRRSGLRAWPLLLVSPGLIIFWYELLLVGMILVDELKSWETSKAREISSFYSTLSFHEVFRQVGRINLAEPEFHVGLALSAASAAAGLLVGMAVAAWFIRSGRWETIVPVDTRPRPAPSPQESGAR